MKTWAVVGLLLVELLLAGGELLEGREMFLQPVSAALGLFSWFVS